MVYNLVAKRISQDRLNLVRPSPDKPRQVVRLVIDQPNRDFLALGGTDAHHVAAFEAPLHLHQPGRKQAASVLDVLGTNRKVDREHREYVIWHSWPLLVLMVMIAAVEWILRKKAGLA